MNKSPNKIPEYFYYNGRLTSTPFITNIEIYDENNKLTKKTYVYVYGKVNQGDYISTYYLKGIGFKTSLKEVACAIALENKNTEEIGLVYAEIL